MGSAAQLVGRVAVSVGLLAGGLAAQTASSLSIPTSDPDGSGGFGWDVALVRGRSVLSVPRLGPGHVELYGAGGQFETSLSADDGVDGAEFGFALDGEGAWIAVGAPGQDLGVGAVYLYQETAAGFVEQRLAPTGLLGVGDDFGFDLALHGDTLVVGAPGPGVLPDLLSEQGAAYVFERQGDAWTQVARLNSSLAPASQLSRRFGTAVVVHGDRIAVGEPSVGGLGKTFMGQVHLFRRGVAGWEPEQVIFGAPRPVVVPQSFGRSLALSSERLAVGEPGHPILGSPGRVNLYELAGAEWVPSPVTVAPTVANNVDGFGRALGWDGDTLFVGSPGSDVSLESAGQVWVFDVGAGAGALVAALRHQPTNALAGAGQSLDVSAGTLLVGAGFDGVSSSFAPGVVRFHADDYASFASWTDAGGATGGDGVAPTLSVDGVLTAGNTLLLRAEMGAEVSGGWLVLGREVGGVPFADGVLVPVPHLLVPFVAEAGSVDLALPLSAALPDVLEVWLQLVSLDGARVATPALRGVTPGS